MKTPQDVAWDAAASKLKYEFLKGDGDRNLRAFSCLDKSVANACIYRFVTAELDYVTPGDRGLGRIDTHLPRFAAYHRERLREAGEPLADAVRSAIEQVMMSGYAISVALHKETPVASTPDTVEDVFRAWVLSIYITPLTVVKPVIALADTALETAAETAKSNRLVGGGWFRSDKTPTMLAYYAVAGFVLHQTEVRFRSVK